MDAIKAINTNHNRFTRYNRGRKLYLGEHADVFSISDYDYYKNPSVDYLVYNYCEVMTNAFCNLIFSESPQIEVATAQEKLEKWRDESNMMTILRECSETASYAGDAVVRLSMENDKVVLEQIDNNNWYPIFDPSCPNKKAVGHVIKYEKRIDKILHWLLEIHKTGKIQYEAYIVQDDGKKTQKPVMDNWAHEMNWVLVDNDGKEELCYTTKCDLPLVFHLKNNSISNEFFGLSDYTIPLVSKVYAINQNLNQIQYVLKRHAHPKMTVSAKLIKQASQEVQQDNDEAIKLGFKDASRAKEMANSQGRDLFQDEVAKRLLRNMEFMPSDVNGGEAKYLTWDGNLNESREQMKTLKQSLYEETQLAKVLVDPEANMGTASGVAILRMAQSSLHKAEKKQSYLREFIKQIVYTYLQLSGESPAYPSVKFRDGLVNDMQELINEETAKLDAGITSKHGAIKRVNDCDDKQADEVLALIQAENNILGGDNPIIT
jgi:Phage portal protein, SPP1 Gp6-like